MSANNMTMQRFSEIVDAYGALVHRWPADERDAALALLADSAEARDRVQAAGELDAMLDAAPAPAPASPDLVARIMAARPRAIAVIAAARQSKDGFWKSLVSEIWPYGSPALPAGALAASIVLGVSFGLSAPGAMAAFGLGAETATASSEVGEQLVAMALSENTYTEDFQE
ncbi:MAG: hypothetical protein V4441_04965 [Pseudomonadota bacterium]